MDIYTGKKIFGLFYDDCVDRLFRLETMMKIHTTQNLSPLGTTIQPTNVVSTKAFRFNSMDQEIDQQQYSIYPSFKGKKPNKDALNKFTKKVVEEAKRAVGDISKNVSGDKKSGDNFLSGKIFNWALGIADHETLVQAIISCIICMVFRPLTIMGISNDKSRQDSAYAAAHSMASGATGLVATLLIANPFKNGEKYAMQKLLYTFKESALKRLYPHLDLNSIKDANGGRKAVSEWLDKSGNRFIQDLKDVAKVPEFRDFANVSAETYKTLGADVDWATMKGKSFNYVVTKDGKSLYDAIDWMKVGIKVNDKGSDGPVSILCKNLDRGFLESLIKDAKDGNNWKKLDVNSVYGKDGLVKDFREWKDISGKQWKLDLDSSYISSAMETADYIPEISGKVRRVSDKSGANKYACYLKNGKNGRLGTEITQEMHDADATTDVQKKILTWFPDIVTRPFVATGTIALIPWMLVNVFKLEKTPKKKATNTEVKLQEVSLKNSPAKENNMNEAKELAPSFKGKGGKEGFIRKMLNKLYGEWYGKKMYESDKVRNISQKLSQRFGEKMTQHFATLGAAVTSSVYVSRTINNNDLDKDRRKTLAINQILCFFIPTFCAYKVDHLLRDFTKKVEYRYSGLKEQEMARLNATGKEVDKAKVAEITKKLAGNLKGVRILSSLVTFTLIYRYITPVLITPLANKISDTIQEIKKAKKEQNEITLAKA